MDANPLEAMIAELKPLFEDLLSLQIQIREKISKYADGKHLKGHELVGWLGEIYVKLLLGGTLVHDRHEHDVEVIGNWRVSVKARRGKNAGWRQTSPIARFEGEGCPTHLAFVHLHNDYSLDRISLFEWKHLCATNRFIPHSVRGTFRSYIFTVDEKRDCEFIIYDASRSGGNGTPNR